MKIYAIFPNQKSGLIEEQLIGNEKSTPIHCLIIDLK